MHHAHECSPLLDLDSELTVKIINLIPSSQEAVGLLLTCRYLSALARPCAIVKRLHEARLLLHFCVGLNFVTTASENSRLPCVNTTHYVFGLRPQQMRVMNGPVSAAAMLGSPIVSTAGSILMRGGNTAHLHAMLTGLQATGGPVATARLAAVLAAAASL